MTLASPEVATLWQEYLKSKKTARDAQARADRFKRELLAAFGRKQKLEHPDGGWIEKQHVVRNIPPQPAKTVEFDQFRFHAI